MNSQAPVDVAPLCKGPAPTATNEMDEADMKPAGEEQEFLEVLNRYQPVLRRVSRMYADSPEEREDLLQETIYQLWRSYPTFRGESSHGTWVYRVALNTAISALRRRVKRPKEVPLEAAAQLGTPPGPWGSESERVRLLYGMIQKLNPVDRALALLYLEDLSYKELSSILGISESNIGVKLNRLKAKLQSFAKELR